MSSAILVHGYWLDGASESFTGIGPRGDGGKDVGRLLECKNGGRSYVDVADGVCDRVLGRVG